jgi:hypothetical protein
MSKEAIPEISGLPDVKRMIYLTLEDINIIRHVNGGADGT